MNQQTVEWLCFAIGGILILTAVLTSIFKINIGGASVEGQSHWTQKIVAFFAGWIFVIIGAVFHGVALSNIPAGSPTQTSQQQTMQPTTPASNSSVDQNRVSHSDPTTASTPKPRESFDVSGEWTDSASLAYKINQNAGDIELQVLNAQNGQTTATGTGSVSGRTIRFTIKSFITQIEVGCTMQLSSDGDRMSGPCQSALGTEHYLLERIR